MWILQVHSTFMKKFTRNLIERKTEMVRTLSSHFFLQAVVYAERKNNVLGKLNQRKNVSL